jgi:tetratricopeptide (TPR) repeat protein
MTQWVDTGPKPSPRDGAILALLKQAAVQRPDDIPLQRRLAQALTATRALDAAIETWQRVAAATPHDATAWCELGRLLLENRQVPQAVEAFEQLCAHTPHRAGSYIHLERALRALGAKDAAEAALDRAIALSPDDPLCTRAVGRRLLRAGMGAALAEHTLSAANRLGWSTWLIDHFLAAHALQGHTAEVAAMLNYDGLVRQELVTPPEPYASLPEFNAAIAEELSEGLRPISTEEYQTDFINKGVALTGGAVDAAHYADRPTPACEALIGLFKQTYAAYCVTAAAASHPTHWQLMPARASIVGGGHVTRRTAHVKPHTHAGSWLVGVYYVAVPQTDADDTSSCLEFGPPVDLEDVPQGVWPHYLIRPSPGLFVLFPGYISHWTVPNTAEEARIVLSFDVQPATA